MVSLIITSIRMDQSTERTSIDHQPWNEGPELHRREDIDLKHGNGMRSDGLVPDPVNAEFRE